MNPGAEWLEPDGAGGFASATASGERTRRYHAVLLVADDAAYRPRRPRQRHRSLGRHAGRAHLPEQSNATSPTSSIPTAPPTSTGFAHHPWPTWRFRLPDGARDRAGDRLPAARRDLARAGASRGDGPLPPVRPPAPISGRDYHALHHENPAFDFTRDDRARRVTWRPYPGLPADRRRRQRRVRPRSPTGTAASSTARSARAGSTAWRTSPRPASSRWDLPPAPACNSARPRHGADAPGDARRPARRKPAARAPSRLHRAADAYIVRRGAGKTVIAGYPWFTDWGRDTFIALRGLCLATGRLDDAARDPARMGRHRVEGMLPNRFPDAGEAPEYNAVDASLWFVDRRRTSTSQRGRRREPTRRQLWRRGATRSSTATPRGTRYGIRVDDDGLLAAGAPASQLTWMDAQGRRLGRHAAPRQAGRGAGALDQRAPHRRRLVTRAGPQLERAPAPRFRRPLLERHRLPARRRRRRPRPDRRRDPPEPDLRRRRPAPRRSSTARPRRPPWSTWSRRELLTPLGLRTLAPGDPGYVGRYARRRRASATARITRARSGRGCSARSSKPGCASAATARPRSARPAPASSPRCSRHLDGPASATSPRSPTATRRTTRAAAPSRPGLWES